MRVALISCVKTKLPHRARAEELYTSTLFRGSLRYARSLNVDRIFILSAKYGLLDLDDEIEPYEETLKRKSAGVLRRWADSVLDELTKRTNLKTDHFVVLAGLPYRRFLTPRLASFEVPLEGMGMGAQLKFYTEL